MRNDKTPAKRSSIVSMAQPGPRVDPLVVSSAAAGCGRAATCNMLIGAADSGIGVFRRKRSEEENPLPRPSTLLNPRTRIPNRKGLGPWELNR